MIKRRHRDHYLAEKLGSRIMCPNLKRELPFSSNVISGARFIYEYVTQNDSNIFLTSSYIVNEIHMFVSNVVKSTCHISQHFKKCLNVFLTQVQLVVSVGNSTGGLSIHIVEDFPSSSELQYV